MPRPIDSAFRRATEPECPAEPEAFAPQGHRAIPDGHPAVPPQRRAARAGFTVIEVFSVIALLAAIIALSIINVDFSPSKWAVRPARDSLIYAVGEAHNQSRLRKEDVFLRYNAQDEALLLENAGGENLLSIPLPKGQVSTMTFYRILPETERSDTLTHEPEEEPVNSIAFSSSGGATPTVIEIDMDSGRRTLIFDPFSLNLLLDAND